MNVWIQNFNQNIFPLSPYATIALVVIGSVLGAAILLWIILKIIRLRSRKNKLDTQPKPEKPIKRHKKKDEGTIVAAIMAAISSAYKIPVYNLKIKSFKRSPNNKW